MNKPNKKKQILKLHDELIFEVACLHCGKTNFNLPYILDSFSHVTCPECKQITIAHVLNEGGIAIATQEERNKAYHAFSKEVDNILRKTRNRIVSKYFGDKDEKYTHSNVRLISENGEYGLKCDLVVKKNKYRRRFLMDERDFNNSEIVGNFHRTDDGYFIGKWHYTEESWKEWNNNRKKGVEQKIYQYDEFTYDKFLDYSFELSFILKYKGLIFYIELIDTYGTDVPAALRTQINHIKAFVNSYNNELVLDIPNNLEMQMNEEP